MVIQSQFTSQVAASLTDAVVTAIDIPRPRTSPTPPAYAENVDHVAEPASLRESEGGHMVVRLASTLIASDVFLRRASVWKLDLPAQKGMGWNGVGETAGAFFPSGASTSLLVRDLVNLSGDTLATDSETVADMLGLPADSATVRSYPGITLMANEYLRLEFYNASGGLLTGSIDATFKLGFNQSDTGKP